MVWWHHWLDGHEFEQALGVGDGQGSLTRCSPQGCKELDMTEWLNWTELMPQPLVSKKLKLAGFMKSYKVFEVWHWKTHLFHHTRLEWKSMKSRDPWSKRQGWSWSTKWSWAKANRVLSIEHIGQSKHPFQQYKRIAEIAQLPNSFYKAIITLIPKPEKDNTKKKITSQ